MNALRLVLLLIAVLLPGTIDVSAQKSEQDRKLFEEYKAKADKGDAAAQSIVGVYYSVGMGVPQDYAEALKWYRKAADQGYAEAQSSLGAACFLGEGVPKDQAEAVKWFRKAADQGYAHAQWWLGYCYTKGEGVPQNHVEAVKWFRKAAEQGNADAQGQLSSIYYYGASGVPQDYAEAVKWVRKSAEQGDSKGQLGLGLCYRRGDGVPQDHAEAVKWFRKAADQGLALAQQCVGVAYFTGVGVRQDQAEAVKWLRKAADQGVAESQVALAFCYAIGSGVAQHDAEAVKWFRKAADQGVGIAQYHLGSSYAKGQGVPQNDLEAYVWWSLAAAQGEKDAPRYRDMVAGRMSREEVVEGQRRAAVFVAKQSSPDQVGEFGAGSLPFLAGNQPKSSGTGFFITDDGYLLSNFHVVAGAARVMLQTKTGLLPAQVVKTDPANDLALLKVSGNSSGLPVISSRTVKLGSTVATVGFPNIGLQGFAPKLAKGEIGALTGAQDDPRYFQISVAVQPGNSGGALVDERGNVVGVVSAKLNARAALSTSGALPENVNYAVKSSFLLSFLESVHEVVAKLKEPQTKESKFEDVVKSAEQAAVLVLVY